MSEPRRIRPPKEYEQMIDRLVDGGLFETKQATMMFAAALGKRFTGPREPGPPGEGIRWYIFEKAGDEAFINALAIVEKDSIDILDMERSVGEDVQDIFERYASGGFQYLKQHVVDTQGDPLENALAILQECHFRQQASPAGLEGIDRATLELLGDFDS